MAIVMLKKSIEAKKSLPKFTAYERILWSKFFPLYYAVMHTSKNSGILTNYVRRYKTRN